MIEICVAPGAVGPYVCDECHQTSILVYQPACGEVHGVYTAVRALISPLTSEPYHQLCDPSCTLWSANAGHPARELNHDGSVL